MVFIVDKDSENDFFSGNDKHNSNVAMMRYEKNEAAIREYMEKKIRDNCD